MSYNFETQFNSPNFTPGRDGNNIEFILCHWWDDPSKNPSYEGVISHFENPSSGVSAHFVATGTDRRVACLVSMDDTAWHAGNWNANLVSLGVECDPRCRDEDYDVVAELIANIRSAYGDLPLKRHSDIVPTSCPGNWDLNRLDALARTKTDGGDWGVVTNKAQAKVQATEADIRQAYLDILERPVDASGLKSYLDADWNIAEVRNDLMNSQEHSVLLNNKAIAQKKAQDDAIAAEAKRKADEEQQILDEKAKQIAIDNAQKLADEQKARESVVVTDNDNFVSWLKGIFEIITKFLTSWRK